MTDPAAKIPQHIAIIMDGNGRWAKKRGLPRIAGHGAGAKAVDVIVKAAAKSGVKVLTLYAFSTENWKRPKLEVDALFKLLEDHLNRYDSKLNEHGIRLQAIGDIAGLPQHVREALSRVMASTSRNTRMTLVLALNYGSRAEIVEAARRAAGEARDGKLQPEEIDEKTFAGLLYTKDLPDPELMIRTSGEMRLSNFMLWQLSYAELYVTKKLWPDFGKEDLEAAILEYQKRERRFGG